MLYFLSWMVVKIVYAISKTHKTEHPRSVHFFCISNAVIKNEDDVLFTALLTKITLYYSISFILLFEKVLNGCKLFQDIDTMEI